MSKLIVMTEDELKKFGLDILAEHEKRNSSESKPKEWLSEAETLGILGIKKPTLAKLRHERKIEFNTSVRPYLYNSNSIEHYRRSKAIKAT